MQCQIKRPKEIAIVPAGVTCYNSLPECPAADGHRHYRQRRPERGRTARDAGSPWNCLLIQTSYLNMAKKSSSSSAGQSLVIVESPAKARTIGKFLGRRLYDRGQHRPHPRPAAGRQGSARGFKHEDWAYLGVNVNKDFEPIYVIPREKLQQVKKLKAALQSAKDLYLATDEDREGEAISWHLCEVLQPKVPVHRLVFHEITEEAIREALAQPAADRPGPGSGPGGAADHRPAVRLRRLAAVVAEDSPAAFGRPGAERRRAADRRAGTAADGLRPGHLLGPDGHVRHGRRRELRGGAGLASTAAAFPPAATSTRPPAS